jgi:hypothetical protein
MGLDQRKRQRKVEKRKAKQRVNKGRALSRRQPQDLSFQLTRAAEQSPILHCVTIAEIWDEGIGHVLISRQVSSTQVAFANLLVDVYCLGVKDVIVQVGSRDQYQRQMYGRLTERYHLQKLKPACARKLVEGSVDFAAQFGIVPHKDYRTAQLIFGDIDAAACDQQFDFGKDGKPFFVAGPNDNESRCREIANKLNTSCGPDGYHFVVPLGGSPIDIDMLSHEDSDGEY